MTTTDQNQNQNQNWYLKGEPFVYDSSVKELFGKCLKLDSSGNKLVVGSNNRATVYSFANFNWNQLGNSLSQRSMSDGRNTLLSSDGTLVLCSITRLEDFENANVWSFGLNTTNNEWNYTYPIIEAPYEINFGFSLALSTDQTVLAVGTPKFRNSFVNMYKLINNTWTFVQTLFWNTTNINTKYGYSVSLNADGTLLAVGTDPIFNTVFVYQYLSERWIEMGSTVVGSSVCLNNNGDMLVTSNHNTGFVYSYRYDSSSGNWKQATSVIKNVEQNILFGFCVCLSGDGTTLAIGAPGKVNTGLHGFVSVYTLETNNDWVLKGTTLEDENRSTQFGFSIDLSTDGNVLAVGAQRANDNVGLASVYLFGNVPLPYPPSNLQATITGETTATLTYTADPSGNTSMYTAKIAGTSSSMEYNSVNAATTIFITGLVPGNSYTFYIVSSNLYGQSAQSTNSNTIILGQVPEPPQYVQAMATGYSTATLTLASSTNATLYKANTTIHGRTVSFTSVNNTPIIYVTNLQAGNIYTFEVFAENQYGTSQNFTLSNTIQLPKLATIIYNTSTMSNQKLLKKVARGCKSQTSNPKWECMLNL